MGCLLYGEWGLNVLAAGWALAALVPFSDRIFSIIRGSVHSTSRSLLAPSLQARRSPTVGPPLPADPRPRTYGQRGAPPEPESFFDKSTQVLAYTSYDGLRARLQQ